MTTNEPRTINEPMTVNELASLVWCDLERDVIVAEGDDAAQFLHSQLANDIANMPVGSTVHSLLLEPTGHLVSLVRVVRVEDNKFLLDVERGEGEVLLKRLSKFILRAKVTLTSSDRKVRAYRGPACWETIAQHIKDASVIVAMPWWDDPESCDVISPDNTSASFPQVGSEVSGAAIDQFRVDAGWPRMGCDMQAGDIPASSGILALAVSFTKGCYPGQELVERMDSRGTMAPTVLRVFPISAHCDSDVSVTSVGRRHMIARVPRQHLAGDELPTLWKSHNNDQ